MTLALLEYLMPAGGASQGSASLSDSLASISVMEVALKLSINCGGWDIPRNCSDGLRQELHLEQMECFSALSILTAGALRSLSQQPPAQGGPRGLGVSRLDGGGGGGSKANRAVPVDFFKSILGSVQLAAKSLDACSHTKKGVPGGPGMLAKEVLRGISMITCEASRLVDTLGTGKARLGQIPGTGRAARSARAAAAGGMMTPMAFVIPDGVRTEVASRLASVACSAYGTAVGSGLVVLRDKAEAVVVATPTCGMGAVKETATAR